MIEPLLFIRYFNDLRGRGNSASPTWLAGTQKLSLLPHEICISRKLSQKWGQYQTHLL